MRGEMRRDRQRVEIAGRSVGGGDELAARKEQAL